MKNAKLEALRRNFAAEKKAAEERSRQAQEMQTKLDALREKAEAAAEAGDLTGYEEAEAEIRKTEAQLYVTKKTRARTPETLAADAADAWSEYADGHNDELSKRWKAYDEARRSLLKTYIDLLAFQNEALSVRQEVADIAGTDPGNLALVTLPARGEDYMRALDLPPEYGFFAGAGFWKNDRTNFYEDPLTDTLRAIIVHHKPISAPLHSLIAAKR